jgi:hypothetical protein
MKKSLLFFTLFSGLSTFAQNCSDLFISEYVEGWSNNKALEIYNPTANTVNLSLYFVSRYSNGSTTASSSNSIQLSGTIAPYGVYVAVLDKRDAMGTGQEAPIWDSLELAADGFYCPVYLTNDAFYWNGNDAIVLAKGSVSNIGAAVLVDVFGKIGQDPENAVAGTLGWSSLAPYNNTSVDPLDKVVTEDHSMIRKSTVQIGKNSPTEIFAPGYVFNPLLEYDSIPAVVPRTDAMGNIMYQMDGVTPQWLGNWFTLGSHDCACNPLAVDQLEPKKEVMIYPNPTTDIFYIKNVEGYEKIEVYNALGQKVQSINNTGKPVISVNVSGNNGLYLVKLTDGNGDQVTKRVIVK